MYRRLTFFFAGTTIILIALLTWLVAPRFLPTQATQQTKPDEDIVFPIKIFVATKAYIATRGTLTADWIAYKNNAYSILCTRDECVVADVEQIGPKQISSVIGPVV
jgi:hypothetical protein